MKPIIQIAGIIDHLEAELVLASGATHLGFPLRLDVHKEDITEAEAAQIIKSLPNPEMSVLITYLKDAREIIELLLFLGCKTIQLHGPIDVNEIKAIRKEIPEIIIWKSLIVKEGNMEELRRNLKLFEPVVDAFITDTYDLDSGASGATGKVHDWQISRSLVEISENPIILAGGLNPGNVYEAILKVKPAGVDAHTGLESSNGRKDEGKCRKFVDEAMRGFESIRRRIPQTQA